MSTRTTHKKIPILMYHSIAEDATPNFKPFTVPPALFAEHMTYLHSNGYTPLTVTQFITRRGGVVMLPERPVMITFDDGFADFFTAALPILQRHNFNATMYIPTAYVGSTSRWMEHDGEGKRPLLSWQHIQEMNASGIECGTHSHTHPQLDLLSRLRANEEVALSKRILEEHLGQPVTSFAYPHGYYTAETQRQLRKVGYTSACTVKYAMCTAETDAFALTRLLVEPTTDVQAFATLLAGQDRRTTMSAYTRPLAPLWRYVRLYSASRQHAHTPVTSL